MKWDNWRKLSLKEQMKYKYEVWCDGSLNDGSGGSHFLAEFPIRELAIDFLDGRKGVQGVACSWNKSKTKYGPYRIYQEKVTEEEWDKLSLSANRAIGVIKKFPDLTVDEAEMVASLLSMGFKPKNKNKEKIKKFSSCTKEICDLINKRDRVYYLRSYDRNSPKQIIFSAECRGHHLFVTIPNRTIPIFEGVDYIEVS